MTKIPQEIHSIILAVKEDPMNKSAKENWYGNARYRMLDEQTCQSIEYERMASILEKGLKIEYQGEPDPAAEGRMTICGRIYKEDSSENKWIYESYKTALAGKRSDIESRINNLGSLVKHEDVPQIDIAQWEEELQAQKAAQSKGKGKKQVKDDKTQKAKNDATKNKSKITDQEEKKEEEETLQDKLASYMDFPIGPMVLDCEKEPSKLETEIVEELNKANPVLFKKCEHGVEIFIKDKQFKTTKQILHHSHILKQIIVRPKVPQIIPQAEIVVENPIEEKKDEENAEEQQ